MVSVRAAVTKSSICLEKTLNKNSIEKAQKSNLRRFNSWIDTDNHWKRTCLVVPLSLLFYLLLMLLYQMKNSWILITDGDSTKWETAGNLGLLNNSLRNTLNIFFSTRKFLMNFLELMNHKLGLNPSLFLSDLHDAAWVGFGHSF